MPDRRAFVAGMFAAGMCPVRTWADAGHPSYVAAALTTDGRFILCGLTAFGQIVFRQPLPARGHAAAAHPERAEAVAFARRPGTFALVIDCVTGERLAVMKAPEGRHFFGHGAFSPDGTVLYTTENDYDAARGLVGLWDARRGYTRIGEVPTGGVGPHEMRLWSDGLVVANGGIETHPETGRAKLNIPTMRSNLTYLTLDGEIIEQVALDPALQKNSIRHIAVNDDGAVAFGMQWQGDNSVHPPLVGLHQRGRAPVLFATGADHREMKGYIGSVAISGAGDRVAVTSPRGGLCVVFDAASGQQVARVESVDVGGVSPAWNGFAMTSGTGAFSVVGTRAAPIVARHPLKWDNHLVDLRPVA